MPSLIMAMHEYAGKCSSRQSRASDIDRKARGRLLGNAPRVPAAVGERLKRSWASWLLNFVPSVGARMIGAAGSDDDRRTQKSATRRAASFQQLRVGRKLWPVENRPRCGRGWRDFFA